MRVSDEMLLKRLLSSDSQEVNSALKEVYKGYYPNTMGFVKSNSGTEEDAADVFQEALLIFHRQLRNDKFRGESSLKSFLFGISRNLWLRQLRKRKVKFMQLDNELDIKEEERFSELILDNDQSISLRTMVRELGADCNAILVAFYFNRMSIPEIMEHFNISTEGAAKNRKYRCMLKLMDKIKSKKLDRSFFN